jgi:hypothetical protein
MIPQQYKTAEGTENPISQAYEVQAQEMIDRVALRSRRKARAPGW